MDKKFSPLIVSFLSLGFASTSAVAVEEPEPSINEFEVGLGYVTDDAYKFGRYNGLEDAGVYLHGDVNARGFGEDGRFWQLRGTNLGLESRYLRLEAGFLGRHEYFLEYDQLPNNMNDTVSTPFLEPGDALLTLPAGFDIDTNLDDNLSSFEVETERKRIGLGASFVARKNWKLDVSYHHEKKDGTEVRGGSMVATLQALTGRTTTSLLPEPIDYDTDMVDVSLQYGRDKGQLELRYHMSLFDNDEDALTWENPFSPGDFGSQALAPDNQFHQLMLTGGYLLPYNTRVSGVLSYGRMTQDQDFEPYTVNPAAIFTGPLPEDSLDGEVWLTTAQFKVASRPLRKLRLSAQYRYDERDSDTDVNTYDYVVADSSTVTGINGPVKNRPLSYDRQRVDLTANYRINTMMSLRGGYKYDDMSRDYKDAEREDTDENTFFAKWKVQPHATVDMALYGELADRDGSKYKTPFEENPALRKYYLADRDRTKYGASIDYMPNAMLSFSASAEYNEDDYDNSDIGLTEATEPVYTLDANFRPRKNIVTYAYYTREDIESKMRGSELGTTTWDWKADFEDTVDTYGIGAKVTRIGGGRWDVGADLVYTKATGDIDMTDRLAPGTETQYPDLETELLSFKLWTLFRYSKDIAYRLSYWYEDYSADNWAVDNLQEDSITNMLLLGSDTLDYDTHVIAASVIYQLD